MERKLLITGCSDPLMWYANMVGQVVMLLGVDDEITCWLASEGVSNYYTTHG